MGSDSGRHWALLAVGLTEEWAPTTILDSSVTSNHSLPLPFPHTFLLISGGSLVDYTGLRVMHNLGVGLAGAMGYHGNLSTWSWI
jgi:hypothetical protein